MKLHNRQIRLEFWSDAEIVDNFDYCGRLFYIGCWQLAEDSGCVENSPKQWQMLLFPGDADATMERLAGYRDRLIELGKLVPYSAGKGYLYIRNFHKHQHMTHPVGPMLPLPSWIRWIPSEKLRRAGRYEIDDDACYALVTASRQPVDSLSTACQQPLNSLADNTIQDNTIQDNVIQQNSLSSPTDVVSDRQSSDQPSAEFLRFYEAYPKHMGKTAAWKAWNTCLKKRIPAEVLITASEHYASACKQLGTEDRYILLPSTFLGPQKKWEDYVNPPQIAKGGVPRNGRHTGGSIEPDMPGYQQQLRDCDVLIKQHSAAGASLSGVQSDEAVLVDPFAGE